MNFRLFGCTKYKRLSHERFDRDLSLAEREFIAKHRAVCSECRVVEAQGNTALNMLRMAAAEEPEFEGAFATDHFEERVIRRLQIQTARESVRYWSPAFVGAAIAGLIVLTALQLVSVGSSGPVPGRPDGAAFRSKMERLPSFDLNEIERIR